MKLHTHVLEQTMKNGLTTKIHVGNTSFSYVSNNINVPSALHSNLGLMPVEMEHFFLYVSSKLHEKKLLYAHIRF